MLRNNTCVSENKLVIHTKITRIRLLHTEVRQCLRTLTFLRKTPKPRNSHPTGTRNINKTGSLNPDPEHKLRQSHSVFPYKTRSLTVFESQATMTLVSPQHYKPNTRNNLILKYKQ